MPKHSETSAAAKMCIPTLLQSICQDVQLFPSMRGVGWGGGTEGRGEGGMLVSHISNKNFTTLTLACVVTKTFNHVHCSVVCTGVFMSIS